MQENLKKARSKQPVQLPRLAKMLKFSIKKLYISFLQGVNNKGADETVHLRSLISSFFVPMQQSQVFSSRGPYVY